MSDCLLYANEFEGNIVHTLTVNGRPAWIAREIGAILGYAQDGKRLATQITGEWSEDFVAGHDFALLLGADLLAVKAQCEAVSPSTKGLLVLFESGLHLTLVKTHMPMGRRLRRFLVDEVLPQLARTGAYAPEPPSPDLAIVARLLRIDLEDRRFQSRTLRQTADALSERGHIDERLWATCIVRACEIALDQDPPTQHDAADWLDADVLAARHDVSPEFVLEGVKAMGLLHRPAYVRPQPVREDGDWMLTFRLSPETVALVEAWIDEHDPFAPFPTSI